jgi:hypothetical protein
VSEWIDVEDRLPTKGGEYLCFQPEASAMGKSVEARRQILMWRPYVKKWVSSFPVTHWQPLPEPPDAKA